MTTTNVILTFDVAEDEHRCMKEVNSFPFMDKKGFRSPIQLFSEKRPTMEASAFIGGTGNTELPIYVGAFKDLDHREFLKHLKRVPWNFPENVRCLICGPDDPTFNEYFQKP